ncbi:unnamed protein product [Ectocarpus sp. 6 AP-2014]
MTNGQEEQRQPQADDATFAEREANDLRELHLSATFLTPFAVAATQDNQVWLSNNQRDYTDHSKQGGNCEMTPVVVKKKTDMAAMIGFQGRMAGRLATETRESHVFTRDFQDYVESRDRTYFRTRDHFSDYAEAKARDPSRSKK